MEHQREPEDLVARARQLRKQMSKPEVLLWMRLKPSRSGLEIRRQVPVLGRFVADFTYPPRRYIFEIDGRIHDFTVEKDSERDRHLAEEGWRTFRIAARDVLRDLDSIVEWIGAVCRGEAEVD
jgi:very-short-patch-repair endonuclease